MWTSMVSLGVIHQGRLDGEPNFSRSYMPTVGAHSRHCKDPTGQHPAHPFGQALRVPITTCTTYAHVQFVFVLILWGNECDALHS